MIRIPSHFRRLRLFTPAMVPIPSLFGTILILCLVTGFMIFFFCTIHPFLAENKAQPSSTIIVEGWLPDYCIEKVAALYHEKKVTTIIVTGGPLENGSYLKEYKTFAALGGATLHHLAVPDSHVYIVPAPYSNIDRTYGSAVALKKWIDSSSCATRVFILCSQSTHTRRSALFFRRALGKDYTIGSIAVQDIDYLPTRWWMSSKGVRSVIDESIAYVYGLFFVTFKAK